MSAEVNSMIGAQSDSTGLGARGLEPTTGYESEGPESHASLEVRSGFGSTADEWAAYGVGSIHPSLGHAVCSEFRSGATSGVISRALSDSRSRPCSSQLSGAPGTGQIPLKITSRRISAK